MEVRKFEALTMQDAIKLVKKELGADAVILSTKEKQTVSKGVAKPYKIVEVLATRGASQSHQSTQAESNTGQQSAPQAASQTGSLGKRLTGSTTQSPSYSSAQSSGHSANRSDDTRTAGTAGVALNAYARENSGATKVTFPRLSRDGQTQVVKGSPTFSALKSQARTDVSRKPGAQEQARQQTAQTPRMNESTSSLSSATLSAQTSGELLAVKEEIQQMRRDIESLPQLNFGDKIEEIKVILHSLLRGGERESKSGTNEFLTNLAVRLRAAGVSEIVIADLSQALESARSLHANSHAKQTSPGVDDWKDFYLQEAVRYFLKNLSVTGPWKTKNDGRPSLCALVGPTGVGKTTSIAKLAARTALHEKKRVALVSLDSFRLAAAEQLRVYAKILNCPFLELSEMGAAGEKDLLDFIQKHPGLDAVFIDTAGRSGKSEAQMQSLIQLKAVPLPIDFHLVLPANMRARDLDENIKGFRSLAPKSLLFTKLDDSWSFGEIVNAAILSRLPLSYFSTGQNVPEDFEVVAKDKVVERLFRL